MESSKPERGMKSAVVVSFAVRRSNRSGQRTLKWFLANDTAHQTEMASTIPIHARALKNAITVNCLGSTMRARALADMNESSSVMFVMLLAPSHKTCGSRGSVDSA